MNRKADFVLPCKSIFPEYVSSRSLDGTLKLEVPIELPTSMSVIISEPSSSVVAATPLPERKPTIMSISLSALPPLLLHIILPPSYPIHSPPEVTSLRASHLWLPDIERLQAALLEMWQAGEPLLYNWVEYIRTGDFLKKMNLLSSTDKEIIV